MSAYHTPTKKEKALILKNYTYTKSTLFLNGVKVKRDITNVPGSKPMNCKVVIGVLTGEPPVRGKHMNNKPRYTHCDECGEALPESELRMGSAYHEQCWKDMIHAGWSKEDEENAKKGGIE